MHVVPLHVEDLRQHALDEVWWRRERLLAICRPLVVNRTRPSALGPNVPINEHGEFLGRYPGRQVAIMSRMFFESPYGPTASRASLPYL
jgi:hypothetical protein